MKVFSSAKVIIVAGTGGVGKTTVAASLAMAAAEEGRRVLVLTIDPARRLATALGLDAMTGEVQLKVPAGSGSLWGHMVQPEMIFNEVLRECVSSPEQWDRLLKNPLYLQLTSNLSGSQEFSSLEALRRAAASQKYDLVILDTPPMQHAVNFLEAPQKLRALLNESIARWLETPREVPGFIRKVFSKGTKFVLDSLEKITGGEFITELADFFQAIRSFRGIILDKIVAAENLIKNQDTHFILVTGYDETKLREIELFSQSLKAGGYHLSSIIINRVLPDLDPKFKMEFANPADQQTFDKLKVLYESLVKYYDFRENIFQQFHNKLPEGVQIKRIPDIMEDINGYEGLQKMSRFFKQ